MKYSKIILLISIITSYTVFCANKKTPKKIQKNKTKEIVIDHNKEIPFGQSIYKSGSFKLYGEIIEKAILACFNKINKNGGINGKKLRLISLDDHGEPDLALKNINLMRKKYKINMFLGNMGTRSILKVLPLIQSGKIAMFFPWGGDQKLRNPNLTNIINGPGLIKPQINAIVDYIYNHLKFKKIAIFSADDNFSVQNTINTQKSLERYLIEPIKTVTYNRFTMNIKKAAKKLLAVDPKVVICLSTNHPTAKLISSFFAHGSFGTYFFGIDSTLFVPNILHEKGARFYYSSAVPDPNNTNIPIVKQYQKELKESFPKQTFNVLSLAYYISAKIIESAIKNIATQVTKEKIIEQIQNMKDFDLEGFSVNFDPQIRHAFGQNAIIIKG